MQWCPLKRRPSLRVQVIAFGLLIGILVVTCAPICGCSIYTDPLACCHQLEACAYPADNCSDDPVDPPPCSNLHRQSCLVDPTKSFLAVDEAVIAAAVQTPILPPLRVFTPLDAAGYWQALIKIPKRPLYVITATYRI